MSFLLCCVPGREACELSRVRARRHNRYCIPSLSPIFADDALLKANTLIVHQELTLTSVSVFSLYQGREPVKGFGKSLIFFERSESPLIVHQQRRHTLWYVFFVMLRVRAKILRIIQGSREEAKPIFHPSPSPIFADDAFHPPTKNAHIS